MQDFNKDSLFTVVFPARNRWFEEAVVETGDELSIIYIFITIFVNNMYFRVQLCFLFRFKNETKYLDIILMIVFPILRNKTKLMINS